MDIADGNLGLHDHWRCGSRASAPPAQSVLGFRQTGLFFKTGRISADTAVLPMIQAIVLSIILHAQTVVPWLGSTQGSTTTPVSTIKGVAFAKPVGFAKPVAFQ